MNLSQQQFDALVIIAYNAPAVVNEVIQKTKTMLQNALLNHYRGLKQWNKYKNGWTNRNHDEVELFFDGDYNKSH